MSCFFRFFSKTSFRISIILVFTFISRACLMMNLIFDKCLSEQLLVM
uniref:Uncharacterized protein n=1 Tax=Arundo donax TaxID=35708 RepID=A0A0A8YWS8_ARUDO